MAWWVIPEGAAGQVIGQLIKDFESGDLGALGGAGAGAKVTVTQSAAKPAGEVAGPFTTQAQAQAQADAINTGIASATAPTAANAAASAANAFGIPTLNGAQLRAFTIRAVKVLVGMLLVVAGVIQLAHPEKTLTAVAKGAVLA